MAEWLKATDCKSVGVCLRWFESIRLHRSYVRVRACPDRTLNKKILLFPSNKRGVRKLADGVCREFSVRINPDSHILRE